MLFRIHNNSEICKFMFFVCLQSLTVLLSVFYVVDQLFFNASYTLDSSDDAFLMTLIKLILDFFFFKLLTQRFGGNTVYMDCVLVSYATFIPCTLPLQYMTYFYFLQGSAPLS